MRLIAVIAAIMLALPLHQAYANQPGVQEFSLSKMKGIPYAQARKVLIENQWNPVTKWTNESTDMNALALNKLGFIEVESCGGSGLYPCSFLFEKDAGSRVRLVTLGEGEGDANVAFYQFTDRNSVDGGEVARSAAYYVVMQEIRQAAPGSEPSAISSDSIRAAAEDLSSRYYSEMMLLPKKFSSVEKGGQSLLMLNLGSIDQNAAKDYCAKQVEEVDKLWGVNISMRKAQQLAASNGVFIEVSGQSTHATFLKIYRKKLAGGDTAIRLTDNQIGIMETASKLTHDHQLSLGEVHVIAEYACGKSMKKTLPENAPSAL